ncbi:kininogen-1 [Heptranchias perlo]|uniref:kininogen-1 n=1 Tax=Heptranchias perlo TaxID=212740 RepID=UPI00355A2DF9
MKLLYIVLFTIHLIYIDAESDSDSALIDEHSAALADCNNPEVLVAVDFTLRKFNAERKDGHHYALYRVIRAEVEGELGRRYLIEFSIRETDCPLGNEKIWKECNYRAPREANTGRCVSNVYIHKTQRITQVTSHNCTISSVHWIVPKHEHCLGCVRDLPTNHSSLNETIDHAIRKFNNESSYENYFRLGIVFKFTHQVVAGMRYGLKFSIQETECSKEDPDIKPSECNVKPDAVTLFCNSTVHTKIWLNYTHTAVSCDAESFAAEFMSAGLAGWGPFTLQSEPQSETESDEFEPNARELTTAEKDLADILEPLTCPGKPWKPLRQIKPAPPPHEEHHDDHGHTQTPFSDHDLLGAA